MRSTITILSLGLVAGCGGGGPSAPSALDQTASGRGAASAATTTVQVTSIEGLVPVAGARVVIDGKAATTDSGGNAVFESLSVTSSTEVEISAEGFRRRNTRFGQGGPFTIIRRDDGVVDSMVFGLTEGNAFRVTDAHVYVYLPPQFHQRALGAFRHAAATLTNATGGRVHYEVVGDVPPAGSHVVSIELGSSAPTYGAYAYVTYRGLVVTGGRVEYQNEGYLGNETLALHELGHTLGLRHNTRGGVMQPTVGSHLDFTAGEKFGITALLSRPSGVRFEDSDLMLLTSSASSLGEREFRVCGTP